MHGSGCDAGVPYRFLQSYWTSQCCLCGEVLWGQQCRSSQRTRCAAGLSCSTLQNSQRGQLWASSTLSSQSRVPSQASLKIAKQNVHVMGFNRKIDSFPSSRRAFWKQWRVNKGLESDDKYPGGALPSCLKLHSSGSEMGSMRPQRSPDLACSYLLGC